MINYIDSVVFENMGIARFLSSFHRLASKLQIEYNFIHGYVVYLTGSTTTLSNQTLNVYAFVCNTKTINIQNSIYSEERKFKVAPNLTNIVLSQ